MLIIADSGSTKTDWSLVDKSGKITRVVTSGLNPYFVTEEMVKDILAKDLYPYLDNKNVDFLYFFGSGCSLEPKKSDIQSYLDTFFINADVSVESDLLGAARALCKNEKGIVSIFGTGASTCMYDGESITAGIPSLGYILGDHGSAADLGMKVLADYLDLEMPQALRLRFEEKYTIDLAQVLDKIYKMERPNKYLGEFAMFLHENREEEYAIEVLNTAFSKFFEKQVLLYPNYDSVDLFMVGSTAHYFKSFLQNIAQKYNVNIRKVEQSPMEGLLDFYVPDYVQSNIK